MGVNHSKNGESLDKVEKIDGEREVKRAPKSKRFIGVRKGNKRQISLTITPELLERVDQMARRLGQSRAAVINMAIYNLLEEGVKISALK